MTCPGQVCTSIPPFGFQIYYFFLKGTIITWRSARRCVRRIWPGVQRPHDERRAAYFPWMTSRRVHGPSTAAKHTGLNLYLL